LVAVLRYRALRRAVLLSAIVGLLGSCGGGGGVRRENTSLGPRIVPLGQPAPKGGGVYKVGSPYSVNGQVYRPQQVSNYSRAGVASWYGELFHGRRTANGEIYDMEALTAAHPTLPLPSYVRVTNLRNGRSLVLRVNDRGPYARDREIDLSWAAASLLQIAGPGTGHVQVDYLGPAPLDGDDSYERQALARQPWAGRRVAFAQSPAKAMMAEARRYSYYSTEPTRGEWTPR
jgi:rare lipoprotein A